MRTIKVTVAVLGVIAALFAVPSTAYADGATFTWTCTDHNDSWTDAACWDQGALPRRGDSVVIDSDTPISDAPAISLDHFTYKGGDDAHIDSADDVLGGITVTGHLVWSGGKLNVPLTIAHGATASVTAGAQKSVEGDLTVAGTLTLDSILDADNDGGLALAIPKLGGVGYSTLHVERGGTLITHGDDEITGAACCSNAHPITVRNDGTISVRTGTLGLSAVLLDQVREISVAKGATLRAHDAVARLRGGSTYAGAGTLLLDHDSTPSPDFGHPGNNQGAVLLEGTASLSGGFAVAMTDETALAGAGTFSGTGSIRLDDAALYGSVRTGAHVALSVTGAQASHVATWTRRNGYIGKLTVGGEATVAKGSSLSTDAGGTVTVGRGGTLSVPAGAALVGPGTDGTPALANNSGGTIRLGGGSGRPTTIGNEGLRNNGTVDVLGPTTWSGVVASQPSGTLRLDARLRSDRGYTFGDHSTLAIGLHGSGAGSMVLGGPAKLAGTIRTVGTGPHARGRSLTPIRSSARSGSFGCQHTSGWLPSYAARGMRLAGLGIGTPSLCGHTIRAGTRLSKRVGTKLVHFAVPHGGARYVLLDVTVKPSRATKVTIAAHHGGHAVVRAGGHRTIHRYVVVRVGSSAKFTARSRHGKAGVRIRYVGNYR